MPVLKIAVTVLLSAAVLWILFAFLPALILFCCYFRRKNPSKKPQRNDPFAPGSYYFPFRDVIISAGGYMSGLSFSRLEIRVPEFYSKQKRSSAAYTEAPRGGFPGGALTLRARFYEGRSCNKKIAILLHGYRAHYMFNLPVYCRFLHSLGFSLLIPDMRAHFDSDGKYVTMGVAEGRDAAAWCRKIHGLYPDSEILLLGKSMGASSALFASDKLEDCGVRAIIADCPFVSPFDQFLRQCREKHVPKFMILPPLKLCAYMLTGENFVLRNTGNVEKSRIPVCFIHGDADTTVDYHSSELLYSKAAPGSELHIVPGAEHCIAFSAGGRELEAEVRDFLNRNFDC